MNNCFCGYRNLSPMAWFIPHLPLLLPQIYELNLSSLRFQAFVHLSWEDSTEPTFCWVTSPFMAVGGLVSCLHGHKVKREFTVLKKEISQNFQKCYTATPFSHYFQLFGFQVCLPSQTMSNFHRRLMCYPPLYAQVVAWCSAHSVFFINIHKSH